jgi:hypothetical protein
VVNPIQGFLYSRGRWSGVLGVYRWTSYSWTDGEWLGNIYFPDDRRATAILRHFPYVARGAESASPIPLPGFLPTYQLVSIAIGLLAAAAFWPVAASRALAVKPPRYAPLLPRDDLEDRLLSMNDGNDSWRMVRKRHHEFVAEWRVGDRSWQSLFGRNGLRNSLTVRLAVDRRRRSVKVIDEGHRLIIKGRWKPEADLDIRRRSLAKLDLTDWQKAAIPNGAARSANGPAYLEDTVYDVSTIKQELLKTVLNAGWTYQPAMFLSWS